MSTFKSFDDFADTLVSAIQANAESLSLLAAKAAEAEMKRRVFNDGKAANGQQIGNYSTNKASYSRKQFAVPSRFRPDPNKKSVTLDGGYAELREINGRQAGYVDLNYTGSLMRSITTQLYGEGHAVVIADDADARIAEFNEQRFGVDIFSAGQGEIDEMIISVSLGMDQLINEIFS